MSDIGRFLPLSQGRGADESGVTGDWFAQAAECLDSVAALLDSLEPSEWDRRVGRSEWGQQAGPPKWDGHAGPSEGDGRARPSGSDPEAGPSEGDGRARPSGWDPEAGPSQVRVAAAAGQLAERSAAALRTPLADAVRAMATDDLAVRADERMTRARADAVVGVLLRIADEFRSPPAEHGRTPWAGRSKLRRDSLRVLTDVVVTGYDIADAAGREIEFPAVATGAVALARVGTAPAAIRAVVRGRTLTATDAGWSFGHGPELAGTAREIVLFLFDRAGVPGARHPHHPMRGR